MKKIFFCNIDFGESLSGVERSSLKRAILFEKYFNISPVFLTAKFNLNLEEKWQELKEIGWLMPNAQYLNIYEDIMDSTEKNSSYVIENKEDWYITEVSEIHHRYYSKINKNFNMYVIWRDKEKNKISYINYFLNGLKIYRNKFDSDGCLAVTQYLTPDNKIEKEIFYKKDGKICLIKKYTPDGRLENIELYDNYSCLKNCFNSESDFIEYWLESKVNNGDLFFIDKNRSWSKPLMSLKNKIEITLITTIHSLHVRNPDHIDNGKINSNYQEILNKNSKIDTIICLTEQQKKDIQLRFKNLERNVVTIPHSMEKTIEPVSFSKRDKNKIVTLARLSSEKQLINMIYIMETLIQYFPEKKLFIYGEGSQRDQLEDLIKSRKLQSNIFLPGYINNISDELNTAILYISTSRVESFSLGILEAISHGLPVISYDVKYGPSSLIRNNINGFLVQKDNQDEFLKKILEYFNKMNGELETYSLNAYTHAGKFSMEIVSKLWAHLILDKINTIESSAIA